MKTMSSAWHNKQLTIDKQQYDKDNLQEQQQQQQHYQSNTQN